MSLIILPDDVYYKLASDINAGFTSVNVLMPDSFVFDVMDAMGYKADNKGQFTDEDWEEAVTKMHEHYEKMNDPCGGDPDMWLDFADDLGCYFVSDLLSSQEENNDSN